MSSRVLAAEFFGSLFLLACIAGAGLLLGPMSGPWSGAVAAALAMTVLSYATGHISGGHYNPAITLGLVAAGRFDTAKAPGYIAAQVLGGVAGALLIGAVAHGLPPSEQAPTFAQISSGYSGSRAGLGASFLGEVLFSALLLLVVVGSTSRRAPPGLAPLAIGICFGLGILLLTPVTGGSLNPARSTATALLGGLQPLSQLWLFWLAPIVGAVIGGAAGRYLQEE